MNEDELRQFASNYMEIWSAGQENRLDQLAVDNLKVDYTHFEKIYRGIPEYKTMLKKTHQFFPDLKIAVEQIILGQNPNSVTVFWEYRGTHKHGSVFGVESSGKGVEVKGITLLRIQNRRVVEERGIVDNMSLAMQVGAMG